MLVVKMKNITKRFPGVVANKRVNFSVEEGEIHALIGENGAGKTTLMNILYGLYPKDEGEIFIRGKEVSIHHTHEAIGLGIGMVHQEFMLVPSLTVTENIILGREPQKGVLLDLKRGERIVQELSQKYNLKVPPQERIINLPIAVQQRVEILKCLYRQADIVILDEPTSVLTPQETRELFSAIKSLKRQGKTIIFISHKLREVLEISDRITVMRDGKVTGEINTAEATENKLAKMMVGREVISQTRPKKMVMQGEPLLEVINLKARDDRGLEILKGISFTVYKGEVLGLAGVTGNGQAELVEVITGLRDASGGRIVFRGKDITNQNTRRIREMGIAYIPQDRNRRGVCGMLSSLKNFIISVYYKRPFSRNFFLNWSYIKGVCARIISEFNIKVSDPDLPVNVLSGGNVQKLIVGRELFSNPLLLIAEDPSRGIDIGAIEFVRKQIVKMQNEGRSVLLVSQDLSELIALSNRIVVIYEGRIIGERNAQDATEEELGLLMAGIKTDSGEDDGKIFKS